MSEIFNSFFHSILIYSLCSFRIESNVSAPTSSSSSKTTKKSEISQSKPNTTSTGDKRVDLEQIDFKIERTNDVSPADAKHSNHSNSTGFSLKNPVSSFRSWVSHKKLSKEDSTTMNHSKTTYGKIDTSPTPRKLSSSGSDNSKRIRTNSASASHPSILVQNHQVDISTSTTASTSSDRVKKKSSFNFRHANPISLLKRTAEPSNQSINSSTNEATSTGGNTTSPLGYLKSLVRGDSSSSEKK